MRAWLGQLAEFARTGVISPAVATTAPPASFPGDPADRPIYASALEHGRQLMTNDQRLRATRNPDCHGSAWVAPIDSTTGATIVQ